MLYNPDDPDGRINRLECRLSRIVGHLDSPLWVAIYKFVEACGGNTSKGDPLLPFWETRNVPRMEACTDIDTAIRQSHVAVLEAVLEVIQDGGGYGHPDNNPVLKRIRRFRDGFNWFPDDINNHPPGHPMFGPRSKTSVDFY